jgi:hypothetical protein
MVAIPVVTAVPAVTTAAVFCNPFQGIGESRFCRDDVVAYVVAPGRFLTKMDTEAGTALRVASRSKILY